MKTFISLCCLHLFFFISCQKEGSENPIQPGPTDFRTALTGSYVGHKICSDYDQVLSDKVILVKVEPGSEPDKLVVNGHNLEVDTTGAFPYPSCCGFRFYDHFFRQDTLFIFEQTGGTGYATSCHFAEKKTMKRIITHPRKSAAGCQVNRFRILSTP